MYSWGDDTSDWAKPGSYQFNTTGATQRARDAANARANGPRTYDESKRRPGKLADPRKAIATTSRNPLVIAVDVTSSMRTWPAQIFDRLPLVYQTLSQYRQDLEISFAAIGDVECCAYPLQVTDFARGYALEERLGAIYAEGGGNMDPAESYGLFAHYVNERVTIEDGLAEKPFMIVFGDVTMQPRVLPADAKKFLGLDVQPPGIDAIGAWRKVCERWNVWFLSRPGRLAQKVVDEQWARAIGAQKIVHLPSEPRAVDYAVGLVARAWGRFEDFEKNLAARQDAAVVTEVKKDLKKVRAV